MIIYYFKNNLNFVYIFQILRCLKVVIKVKKKKNNIYLEGLKNQIADG